MVRWLPPDQPVQNAVDWARRRALGRQLGEPEIFGFMGAMNKGVGCCEGFSRPRPGKVTYIENHHLNREINEVNLINCHHMENQHLDSYGKSLF